MKSLIVFGCLFALSSATSGSNDTTINYVKSARKCPKGFTYAGEDTRHEIAGMLGSSYWTTQEVARSPVYSCYRVLSEELGGFNEALAACDAHDAHLVALEDEQEIERVIKYVPDARHQLTTSALYFQDVEKWIWLGSNQTVVTFKITPTANATKEQCLSLFVSGNSIFELKPIRCNSGPMKAMCEARVQTVTYFAWFYTNWLSFLLVLMTFLLMSALCLSVFKYKSGNRVYRSTPTATRRVTVVGNAPPPSHLPYNDAPPTYNDVTGTKAETKMDKYKNKGKDILAKVTLYRNTATNSTAIQNNP